VKIWNNGGEVLRLNSTTLILDEDVQGHAYVLPLSEIKRAMRFNFLMRPRRVNLVSVWKNSPQTTRIASFSIDFHNHSIGCQQFDSVTWGEIIYRARRS